MRLNALSDEGGQLARSFESIPRTLLRAFRVE